jgi:hypothetical protein
VASCAGDGEDFLLEHAPVYAAGIGGVLFPGASWLALQLAHYAAVGALATLQPQVLPGFPP